MNPNILGLLLTFGPKLLDWINSRFAVNGTIPTKEELEQHINDNLDKYIQIGDDWLKDHPNQG